MSAPHASDEGFVTGFLKRLDAADRVRAAAGFPRLSAWWRAEAERMLRGKRKRWVVRVGRRGGKSSSMAFLAVCWALWGDHSVPLGDIGVIAFVSISKDEASSRLRTIASILTALGVVFEQRDGEIEIGGARPVIFKVFACTTTAVVGFTSIAVFCDEVALWESRDTGANPAREIVASLAPTMATQASAFMVLSSSPWSVDDYHAEQFDLGETTHQMTSFAPTWIANPTLTEERTHELEPDLRVWSRNYAAIPSSTLSAAFSDTDSILAAFAGRMPSGTRSGKGWIAIDPNSQAGAGGDGFGICGGWTTDEGEIVTSTAGEFPGDMPLKQIEPRIVALAKTLNVTTIFSDQRESGALTSIFANHNLTLIPYAWSETSKMEAIAILSRWFSERRLLVLPDLSHQQAAQLTGAPETARDKLRRELLAIKAKMMPSGRIQFNTSGADIASCLITLSHAQNARDFVAGEPINPLFAAIARARANGTPIGGGDRGPSAFDQMQASLAARHRGGFGGGGGFGW